MHGIQQSRVGRFSGAETEGSFHVLLEVVDVAPLVGETVWTETGQAGRQLWRATSSGRSGRGNPGAGPHLDQQISGSLNFPTSVPQVCSTKRLHPDGT